MARSSQSPRGSLKWVVSEILPLFFSFLALGVGINSLYQMVNDRWKNEKATPDILQVKLDKTVSEQERLKRDLQILGKQVEALSRPIRSGGSEVQIEALISSIKGLEERFSRIENVILEDPAKALEVPILRKDLERANDLTVAQIAGMRQDVERTYSLITGTMIALALAVLAPALSNLFRKERGSTGKVEEPAPNPTARADG